MKIKFSLFPLAILMGFQALCMQENKKIKPWHNNTQKNDHKLNANDFINAHKKKLNDGQKNSLENLPNNLEKKTIDDFCTNWFPNLTEFKTEASQPQKIDGIFHTIEEVNNKIPNTLGEQTKLINNNNTAKTELNGKLPVLMFKTTLFGISAATLATVTGASWFNKLPQIPYISSLVEKLQLSKLASNCLYGLATTLTGLASYCTFNFANTWSTTHKDIDNYEQENKNAELLQAQLKESQPYVQQVVTDWPEKIDIKLLEEPVKNLAKQINDNVDKQIKALESKKKEKLSDLPDFIRQISYAKNVLAISPETNNSDSEMKALYSFLGKAAGLYSSIAEDKRNYGKPIKKKFKQPEEFIKEMRKLKGNLKNKTIFASCDNIYNSLSNLHQKTKKEPVKTEELEKLFDRTFANTITTLNKTAKKITEESTKIARNSQDSTIVNFFENVQNFCEIRKTVSKNYLTLSELEVPKMSKNFDEKDTILKKNQSWAKLLNEILQTIPPMGFNNIDVESLNKKVRDYKLNNTYSEHSDEAVAIQSIENLLSAISVYQKACQDKMKIVQKS